jgi:hypothetical protein
MVAHAESRRAINLRHGAGKPENAPESLPTAVIEVKYWQSLFDIDTLIDNDGFYVISGVKK